MKTKVEELYKEWCGEDRHVNDCHPVHDSTETIEFAEYYYKEMKQVNGDSTSESVLPIPCVMPQSEQLKAFIRWNNKHNGIASPVPEIMADHYIKSL